MLNEYLKFLVEAIQKDDVLRREGIPDILEEILEEFDVKLTTIETYLLVDMAPKSGEGHDYMFRVDMGSGKVITNTLTIGEIIPDPEEYR